MSVLQLWNNDLLLALVLTTSVLAIGCIAAKLLRRSAATRNSVLLPALIVTMIVPLAMIAARGAGWSIALPLLPSGSVLESPASDRTNGAPSPRARAGSAAPPAADALTGEGVSPLPQRLSLRAVPITTWLLMIWGLGTMFCLIRLGRSYLSLWRLLANAHPVEDPDVTAEAARAAAALGLTRYPTILSTPRLGSPVAVGTPRHGWVIWPPDALEELPREQLFHVLMHEGAHIAHRDSSLRLLQGLFAAVWWWHPLVHLFNRELSRTREELCDNAVLNSSDPTRYGRTLLDFERLAPAPPSPALAVGLFPEHERLEVRIRNLLNPRRSTMVRSKQSVLFTACLAGVAASALAGATRVTEATSNPGHELASPWQVLDDRVLAREYTLSLEDASMPGHLDIDIKQGDILVTAYDGEELLVRLSVPKAEMDSMPLIGDRRRAASALPLDFEVRQNVNFIELDANSYEQTTHVEVFVPRRIDLTLDSYRSGVIRVFGVEGHILARSNHNDITMAGIRGTADVYGYNGNITADFDAVAGDIEFESYNGSIDLTLPADIRSTTYLRAESQDVRSDFAIAQRPAELVVTENEDGSRSTEFGKYVIGDINGGGSRTLIETTNGSVVLRKP